ncbi:MAG: hypothetical protein ACREN4_08045 [Candidatus Dormibacteria bacterium]
MTLWAEVRVRLIPDGAAYRVEVDLPSGFTAGNTFVPAPGATEAEILEEVSQEVAAAFNAGELGPRTLG